MANSRKKENILVGTAAFFRAPVGTAGPADSVPMVDIPNDGTEATNTWGANWDHPGFTEEGLSTNFERETTDHNVEEDPLPAFITVNTANFTISISFAENTLENMALAYGGGSIETVGEKTTLTLAEDLDELAVGFEGIAPSGKMRRVIIPRVVSSGSVETARRRSESKALFPAEFRAICALSQIDIADLPKAGIPAAATGP